MATGPMSKVALFLHSQMLRPEESVLTDGQLLDCYLSRRDEVAFAALMWRHGRMVWGVCRRILPNWHDAEDAFQATFLVVVRRAADIASKELLANWLYGVARQTALKARATAAKRTTREGPETTMPEPAAEPRDLWQDLQRKRVGEVGLTADHLFDGGIFVRNRNLGFHGELETALADDLGVELADHCLDRLGHHRLSVDLPEVSDWDLARAESAQLDAILEFAEPLDHARLKVGGRHLDLEFALEAFG